MFKNKKQVLKTILLIIFFVIIIIFSKNEKVEATTVGEKTINDGLYTIKSAANENFVVDLAGASMDNCANIGLWNDNGGINQKFEVKYIENGYYTISSACSEKMLDVAWASKANGANVEQYMDNGGDNQKWLIKDAGNGYYYVVSKCNDLYLDITGGIIANGTNIEMWQDNGGGKNQKFKFEGVDEHLTIEDGMYAIKSALNENFVIDVPAGSKENCANIELWESKGGANQRFNIKSIGDGYYTISPVCSDKMFDVAWASKANGANVEQYEKNGADNQKWLMKDAGNGYCYIISKCNNLYLDVTAGKIANGTNIEMWQSNCGLNQKFKLEKANVNVSLDTTKYPGYKEKIESLLVSHPNWNFKFLYTGITFANAVNGEASVPARNLVPTDYAGEWINGYTLYDSGWYAASAKAIAYYLDPRNFLDDVNVFQFQDVNSYMPEVSTLAGIQNKVNGTFLSNYANDINTACYNKNVNPYYIIARLIQEQGTNGTAIGKGMDGGDGKIYYNPFDIGASGNGPSEIYDNALAKAKSEGWDTMEKALEGGIYFCKANWLENYQNTLYQNRFDIDSTNGTALYTHQYMQNLMGAYSEARILRSTYANLGKIDSSFTFIIPLYEGMDSTVSPLPSSTTESYPMDFETTGTNVRLRSSASSADDSNIICEIAAAETKLISAQRGVGSDWQKVITTDGKIGYITAKYLKSIDVQTNCNYTAKVKTNDGKGCNVRIGPSARLDQLTAISDGTIVTVINEGTYNNIDGYNWSRVILSSGAQGFMPINYLAR